MAKHDIFHIILNFLYERPLDGTLYDIRECVNGKLNMQDGVRNAFSQFQKVIDFLQKKEYIIFEQKPALNETTNKHFKVTVKYGEDPTGHNSEEADFRTTYPMTSLTLAGSNYIYDRRKEKVRHRIYIATFIVAFAGMAIALLNFLTNTKQANLQYEIDRKDTLIKQIKMQQMQSENKVSLQKKTIDSLLKVIVP